MPQPFGDDEHAGQQQSEQHRGYEKDSNEAEGAKDHVGKRRLFYRLFDDSNDDRRRLL